MTSSASVNDKENSGAAKKRTCTKQSAKKYTSRASPAYPANARPALKRKKGNDGKM